MKLKPNSNIERFKFFVRTKYAWPGGYPMYMLCADGGCICHKRWGERQADYPGHCAARQPHVGVRGDRCELGRLRLDV